MKQDDEFHILIVGWERLLKEHLWDRVNAKSAIRFSQLLHPKHAIGYGADSLDEQDVYYFYDHMSPAMPTPDHEFLASLEQWGVPTIHNMIMGDRIVWKLNYTDALQYATFLARRLSDLIDEIEPSVIIGGFDALHNGIALAVARQKKIPWFALNFSVLPPGLACFTDQMLPCSRVTLTAGKSNIAESLSEETLQLFESRRIQVPAWIPPPPLGVFGQLRRLPQRMRAVHRTIKKSRNRQFLQFVEDRSGYNVWAAWLVLWRGARARKALSRIRTLQAPPDSRYVFFGLHFQPEASIDVWAPFFSNQIWIIELLSRSIPPTHKLLVKIHKSDVSNYSLAHLKRMLSFPGVEIVAPHADTLSFLRNADLVISIQGTIGHEAALLGKPLIMLGDSPFNIFPSASQIGKIQDLPDLIKSKLEEEPPGRADIVNANASYLAPFRPACHNDWRQVPSAGEIDNFVKLFDDLRLHLSKPPK
jgi:hypothetical protein